MTSSDFNTCPLGTDQDFLKIIRWRSFMKQSVAKLAFVCLWNRGKSYVHRQEKSLNEHCAHTRTSSLRILHCNYRPNTVILRTWLKSVHDPNLQWCHTFPKGSDQQWYQWEHLTEPAKAHGGVTLLSSGDLHQVCGPWDCTEMKTNWICVGEDSHGQASLRI